MYLEVDNRTPGDEGSYPDDDLKALLVEGSSYTKTALRMCEAFCGLYYFEYREPLAANSEVMTLFLSTKALFETGVGYANQLGWGKRQWPVSLNTVAVALPDSPQRSVWLMGCYSNSHFWAISESDVS